MITKEEFEFLYSDEITKKNYNDIISRINLRFSEICSKFFRKNSRSWFDYDNGSYDGKSNGHFDPDSYREEISVIGEYLDPPPGYDLEFPTRWLWEEDWEDEMKTCVKEFTAAEKARKKKAEASAAKRKEKREQLKASIKKKLTAEEFKIIKFK